MAKTKTFSKTKAPSTIDYVVWSEYPQGEQYGGRVSRVDVCTKDELQQVAGRLARGDGVAFVAKLASKQKVSIPLVFEDVEDDG